MELPAGVEAIPSAQIVPVEGNEGILGRGALGEVRRGVWVTEGGNETAVALKRLFMLRDDDTAMAEMGGALLPEENVRWRSVGVAQTSVHIINPASRTTGGFSYYSCTRSAT